MYNFKDKNVKYKINYLNLKEGGFVYRAKNLHLFISKLGGTGGSQHNNMSSIEENLSIINPLFVEFSPDDIKYHLSKGAPYFNYFFWLKDGNRIVIGFDVNKTTYKIEIIFIVASNEKYGYDNTILSRKTFESKYVYYTKWYKINTNLINELERKKLPIINTTNESPIINTTSESPIINTTNESPIINTTTESPIINTTTESQTSIIPRDRKLTLLKLANMIKNEKTLFETGAGISAEVIPSTQPVKEFIEKNYNIEDIIRSPNEVINKFEIWFGLFFSAIPTKGHVSLKNICELTNSSIITGNFDMLHQKSGIVPFRFQGHIRKYYVEDRDVNASQIKLLVCIGMRTDFREEVKYYRDIGTIIVIFVLSENTIPTFRMPDDYIVIGDIHKNLIELEGILNNI